MAEGDLVLQYRAHDLSLGLYGFSILSAVVGLRQSIKQGQGSGGEEEIISLCASISLFAFAASVALPRRYITILCRISFFFSVLACSFLLSPLVPHKLVWVPHLACAFAFFQLLPASLQRSLQQLWWDTWNAIRDVRCTAQEAPATTSNGNSQISTTSSSSDSSAATALNIEEGDAEVVNGSGSTNKSSSDI